MMNERWKYTDLTQVSRLCSLDKIDALRQSQSGNTADSKIGIGIELTNGFLQKPLKIDGASVCSLSEAIQNHKSLLAPFIHYSVDKTRFPFANLNIENLTNGLFIYVPDNITVTSALHLFFNTIGDTEFTIYPQHIIVMGKNSKLTIIEEYTSKAQQACLLNQVKFISIDESSELTFYKIQHDNKNIFQLNHVFAEQQANSQLNYYNFTVNNEFIRDDIQVQLKGQNATCHTRGFYHLKNANEYIDNHIDIIHSAPNSKSEMLYKGILDKNSRAVFNGRLEVAANSQNILAYQANHHLLLSKTAEAYSKPELEIYADDVKCKHGSTTGQIDEDALFYLCSRGIPQAEAKQMLFAGFAEDILKHIQQADIKQYIKESISC